MPGEPVMKEPGMGGRNLEEGNEKVWKVPHFGGLTPTILTRNRQSRDTTRILKKIIWKHTPYSRLLKIAGKYTLTTPPRPHNTRSLKLNKTTYTTSLFVFPLSFIFIISPYLKKESGESGRTSVPGESVMKVHGGVYDSVIVCVWLLYRKEFKWCLHLF